MTIIELETLAVLLKDFRMVVPSKGQEIDAITTLVENEIFERLRREEVC